MVCFTLPSTCSSRTRRPSQSAPEILQGSCEKSHGISQTPRRFTDDGQRIPHTDQTGSPVLRARAKLAHSWKNLGDAVVEEIQKPALTGATSKPRPDTATGLGPAVRAILRPTPGTHSPDSWVSAEFKQSWMPAAAGEMQGKGSKAEIWTAPICSRSHHAFVKDGLSA